MGGRSAAIVTVGSELVEGLRVDTNTAEIARAIAPRGFHVKEAVSIGDDIELLAEALRRLTERHALVVTTGGLGPTHDDITRDGAALALGLPLVRDAEMERFLAPAIARHSEPAAAERILLQALVLEGAERIMPVTGTAPGLIVSTAAGALALLPGPPTEMRPMLAELVARYPLARALPAELGVAGLTESDAQVLAQRALAGFDGVGLTVLAYLGDVRVILVDEGAGDARLAEANDAVRDALGLRCYSASGETLAEVVVKTAAEAGLTIAAAESCTGGMVGSAITDVPGSSDVFLGGVISYADDAKRTLLGVHPETLKCHGAVSAQTAEEMARGARERLGADIAVSITGIAGPGGGTRDKPVGLVWFAIVSDLSPYAVIHERLFPGTSRDAVRKRAAAFALDLVRLELMRSGR